MIPSDFRKITNLDRALLFARQAKNMLRESYVSDPDMNRSVQLDEMIVLIEKYEDTIATALDAAYEHLNAQQSGGES